MPPNAVVITNTRTNDGFGNYVVGDCRRKDCRVRRKLLQSHLRSKVEFDITIMADDSTAGDVGFLLESIQSPNASGTGDLFLQQLGKQLGNGTSDRGLSVGLTREPSSGDVPSDSLKSVSIDGSADFVCSPGQYIVHNASKKGADKCGVCPAGSMGDGTDAMCFLCPPHHYASKPGSAKCKPCAKGFFQEQRGGHSCVACPTSQSDSVPLRCKSSITTEKSVVITTTVTTTPKTTTPEATTSKAKGLLCCTCST